MIQIQDMYTQPLHLERPRSHHTQYHTHCHSTLELFHWSVQ